MVEMDDIQQLAARTKDSGSTTTTGYVISNGGPSVKAGLNDGDQVMAYLGAHELSHSTWRYTYILWIIFGCMGAIYTLGHHVRLPGTSLGSIYSKWSMKRTTFGGKVGVKARSLPSNGNLASLVLIVLVAFILCVVGPDYLAPDTPALGLTKRAGNPEFTISKTWWSSGSRFGDIAFAMIPLVILFALRSAPFNILSPQWTMGLLSDKFLMLHKCIGWFIWGLTTLHVVFWTVNLAIDQHNGKSQWYFMFNNHRFVGGCTAYTAMTLLMFFSLKPVRLRRFEIFYLAHIVLVILMMVFCVVHHQAMWWWIGIPAILWACERVYRFTRFMRINGWLSKKGRVESGSGLFRRPTIEYGMENLKPMAQQSQMGLIAGGHSASVSRPSSTHEQSFNDDWSRKPLGNIYDFTNENGNDDDQSQAIPHSIMSNLGYDSTMVAETSPLAGIDLDGSIEIPPGYALAQLLPSRTIRLTIRPVNPFSWPTGSSCILTLPDLSVYQTHPFTITNNGPDIVIIVKARKGLTRKLFNLVRTRSLAMVGIDAAPGNKQIPLESLKEGDGEIAIPPVFLRAWVDGPFGSVQRARWNEYSTVLMICGGSGVSFGTSVVEFVCQTLAKAGRSDGWRTQRARLCWVVREYAEIAWVAKQLRKCQQMVPAHQLQIDIFVTKAKPRPAPEKIHGEDALALPKPLFAFGDVSGRTGSTDSLSSMMSHDHLHPGHVEDIVDAHLEENYADIIDLTNYEDEEDNDDPNELLLSNRIQQQGKIRRARTRDTIRRKARSVSANNVRPATPELNARDEEGDEITDAPFDPYDPFSSAQIRAHSLTPSHGYSDEHDHLRRKPHGRGHTDSHVHEHQHSHSSHGKARPNTMILLETGNLDPQGDAGIWIGSADFEAMQELSEVARPGKPKLTQILEEEIELAGGDIIVGTCGPVTLNTMVRKIVSSHISPGKIRQGDRTGHIALFSEDYE